MPTHYWMHDYIRSHGFCIFKGRKSKSPLTLDVNLNARFIKVGLQQSQVSLNLEKVVILDKNGNNISNGASVIVSSAYNNLDEFDGSHLIDDSTVSLGFHSKNEQSPWVVIDLQSIKNISKIFVYNRDDKFHTRALSILIEASENLQNWDIIHDNALYRKQDKYLNLSPEDKILCDLAALQPSNAIHHKNTLIRSKKKKEVLTFIEKANQVLEPYKLALGPHGLTETFAMKTKEKLDKAYQELSTFLSVLNEELAIPSFASSGTLLGLVRNGEFLGHDDDIDVCYVSNKSTEVSILAERQSIIRDLTSKGYKVQFAKGSAHLWIRTPLGIDLDLFTGWRDKGRCILNPLSKSGVEETDIFPLKTINSHGVDISIPNDPAPLLVLNYGPKWEVPDTAWAFDWSTARKEYNFLYN